MRNLTDEILKSKEYQKTWSKEKLDILIKLWGEEDGSLKFDCDIESGEQWISIFKNNTKLAMIGIKLPILFLNERCVNNIKEYDFIKEVHVVRDIDFDTNSWYINLDVIKHSVPELNWHASADAVNSECISINDFWYATI